MDAYQSNSLTSIEGTLKARLAARAAQALGMPLTDALSLPRATLVTILEEYADYRARDEKRCELEAKAICDGIFTREELAQLGFSARDEAHAALRVLDVLDTMDAPVGAKIGRTSAPKAPRSWPSEVLVLVNKLVAVIASQEESLAMIRSELAQRRAGEPVLSEAPPSVHTRDTLSSELAPLRASRCAAVELEGIVSYIGALGSLKNLPLPELLEPIPCTRRVR